ncbi:MAG: NADPH-dependent F420 reductase [Anaerolineae bacterium]|nr:NADPH-dependent F420 reductase [Anaerolineae bacterium]
MTAKPTIAILGGTGKEGPGLALRWAHAGYTIIIGSRQSEKALATAAELNTKLGIDTITGLPNDAAALAADISVLTVVATAQQAALHGLKPALQGKILVDATARVAFQDPRPPSQPSAGRIAQDILGPGVAVVAAFQNVPASALKKNLDQPVGSDVLVCADDLAAAEKTITLTQAAGMRAFYAGGLDNAVVVEGLTALLIAMNKYYGGHASIQVAGIAAGTEPRP